MCIFCKIGKKEISVSAIHYEDNEVIAFDDNAPLAPVHILIIPKAHIESINDLEKDQADLVGKMILVAREIAKNLKISENGYKLLFRVGIHGQQEIPHIHLHLIGGAQLEEKIGPA